MGLFGGGAHKRRVVELEAELGAMRADLHAAQAAKAELEKGSTTKERAVKDALDEASKARESLKKAKAKADKANKARSESDKRVQGLKAQIADLEKDGAEFRQAMLTAQRDAEKARAARMNLAREVEALRLKKTPAARPAATSPVVSPVVSPVMAPPRQQRHRLTDDERVERLEGRVAELKEARDDARGKVGDAEKHAHDAEFHMKRELGRADAALRDVQHHLQSERKAYQILQLQYEALVDTTRGVKQTVDAQVKTILTKLQARAQAAQAEAPAEIQNTVATVLPDAPVATEPVAVKATPVVVAEPVAVDAAPVVVAEPVAVDAAPPVVDAAPASDEDH